MMLLEMACQGHGERRALTCGGATYSYAELYRAAGRGPAGRRAARAARGGLLDVSSPAVPIALFASAWAGLPFVPLNYRLAPDVLDRLPARLAPPRLRL